MWIGMNDLEMQNYFIWSDGQLVRFTYWDSGRPTNHNTYNKNCVEMLYKVWQCQITITIMTKTVV